MIGFIEKFKKLLREQQGAVAVVVAASLTGIGGLTAAAVDLGMLYTARAELQNAADAAALAGASTMVGYDDSGSMVAQCDEGISNAKQVASSNKALAVNLTLLDGDITMGYWDSDNKAFDPSRTGYSADPADLTAFQVTLRRDQEANSPVTTIFAGIVGMDQVNIRATSTAFLGYAGTLPSGEVDLPIAVKEDVVTGPGGPRCDTWIIFHSEREETAEWTTFFQSPANDPNVRDYVDGSATVPEVSVGDMINVINGNLSNHTFRALQRRFRANQVNGNWNVTLPVIKDSTGSSSNRHSCSCQSTQKEVVGFVSYVITGVYTAPRKTVSGYMVCDVTVENSSGGGGNYGTRASNAQLVQ
jgi:Flp pilus assembly protein TadG